MRKAPLSKTRSSAPRKRASSRAESRKRARSTGPTSTFIGGSLLNWLMISAMEWLKDHGHELPVLRSQNVPGSIERNRAVGAKYRHRLSKQLA